MLLDSSNEPDESKSLDPPARRVVLGRYLVADIAANTDQSSDCVGVEGYTAAVWNVAHAPEGYSGLLG